MWPVETPSVVVKDAGKRPRLRGFLRKVLQQDSVRHCPWWAQSSQSRIRESAALEVESRA